MKDQEVEWLLKEKHQGNNTADFYSDIKRLEAGEPLAYIIGSIPFLNTTIFLDTRPLIPRVETEFMVESVIKEILASKTNPNNIKILDLCAGSGCIGIAISKSCPSIDIDFIEYETRHLETIKKNCIVNNIDENKYRIIQGNLFDISSKIELYQYDYIVSNPPYIDSQLDKTESSVRNFEPHLALFGGEKGVEIIKKIIQQAPIYLNEGGQLWIEHEPEQVDLINTFAKNRFVITTHKDQYKIERFSKLVLQ